MLPVLFLRLLMGSAFAFVCRLMFSLVGWFVSLIGCGPGLCCACFVFNFNVYFQLRACCAPDPTKQTSYIHKRMYVYICYDQALRSVAADPTLEQCRGYKNPGSTDPGKWESRDPRIQESGSPGIPGNPGSRDVLITIRIRL